MPPKLSAAHKVKHAKLRRAEIYRRVVLQNQHWPVSELKTILRLKEYTPKMRVKDIAFFEGFGCNIEIRPSHNDPRIEEIAYKDGPHTDADEIREDQNRDQKQAVARLVAGLICAGPTPLTDLPVPQWVHSNLAHDSLKQLAKRLDPEGDLAGRIEGVMSLLQQSYSIAGAIESRSSILGHLQQAKVLLGERRERLKDRLETFWRETSRLIAVDSGTTNIALAELLKDVTFPLPGAGGLRSLSLCTNSRRIFEILGHHKIPIKTIMIGGQQRYRSPTVAGMMAEAFLRSVPILRFGMCIIGSTGIDLNQFAICSDSAEESSIKNLIMDRSALRVLCVDDSKFQYGLGRESYKFASIDPDHIDLIVTNAPVKGRTSNLDQARAEFLKKKALIEARGVPVLVATSEKTISLIK